VVSKQTAAIEVQFDDGTHLPAQIIDTGDARANFFVLVWSTPTQWEKMVALDAIGLELEAYRRPPDPPIANPAPRTRATSNRVSATRAGATSSGTSATPTPNSP
jgi:hypothetical protein